MVRCLGPGNAISGMSVKILFSYVPTKTVYSGLPFVTVLATQTKIAKEFRVAAELDEVVARIGHAVSTKRHGLELRSKCK